MKLFGDMDHTGEYLYYVEMGKFMSVSDGVAQELLYLEIIEEPSIPWN